MSEMSASLHIVPADLPMKRLVGGQMMYTSRDIHVIPWDPHEMIGFYTNPYFCD